MPSEVEYETPSWDEIYELALALSQKVKESGYAPDLIVGIARGGWLPAILLSDFLGNPNVASVKAEFYLGIYETAKRPKITQPVSTSVRGRRVLLVDDVADTGESLELVRDHLLAEGASEVRIGTLYYKPWSKVVPDFFAKRTERWIIFPWNRRETVELIGNKLLKEGKSVGDVERFLVERAKLDPSLVKRFVREVFGSA